MNHVTTRLVKKNADKTYQLQLFGPFRQSSDKVIIDNSRGSSEWKHTGNLLGSIPHLLKPQLRMAREDFLDIVTIVDLNNWLSLKCIFSIQFVFVTSNTNIGKFQNMVRNHMLLIIDVKAAIVCKHCF
jgi:hypothetical protein